MQPATGFSVIQEFYDLIMGWREQKVLTSFRPILNLLKWAITEDTRESSCPRECVAVTAAHQLSGGGCQIPAISGHEKEAS